MWIIERMRWAPLAIALLSGTALAQQPGPIWTGSQFDNNTIIMNSAPTGQAPGITVGGQTSDTNVDLNIRPKGAGHVNVTGLSSSSLAGADLSTNPVAPLGGTTTDTLASAVAHISSPYNFLNSDGHKGPYADTQRQICAVTTTTGSNQLIAGSPCSFAAGDVGKLLVVNNAGSSPTTPLATTIAGFTSSTTITMGAAAGQTLAAVSEPVTWGHDDAAALQGCITAAAQATGLGRCVIPSTQTAGVNFWGTTQTLELY